MGKKYQKSHLLESSKSDFEAAIKDVKSRASGRQAVKDHIMNGGMIWNISLEE